MMSTAVDLNDRQRAYLLAIFETDQAVEADMRSIPYRPFQSRPKASEWRWLEYATGSVPTALYKRLSRGKLIDQGTGSTFEALRARGLVLLRYERGVFGEEIPFIRLTTNGRRLARAWTGAKAHKAPPPGTLKEWHWRALAKAWAAGVEGIEGEYGVYAYIGERTWQWLLEHRSGALVAERRVEGHSYYVRR